LDNQLTTSDLTLFAKIELTKKGYIIWRQNSNPIPGRAFIGKVGAADITGFEKETGKRVECEVKKIGDRLSIDQKEFLQLVSENNGIALVCWQENKPPYGTFISTISEYLTLNEKMPRKGLK